MAADQVDELRFATQKFLRSLGTLAVDVTPCGKPLPIGHAHALMVLLVRGELSQQDLGKELSIDKSNVTRLCARMVKVGHAVQKSNDQDGRSRMVSLTSRGKHLAQEVTEASRARFESLLRSIPKARRLQMIAALNELTWAVGATASRSSEKG